MHPCVLVTGATGRLGGLVLAALRGDPTLESCDLFATHHRRDPQRPGDGERWVPFSLAAPEKLRDVLPRSRPMLVLHLACSMSADFGTVFRVDCRGTERLADVLHEIANDEAVGFVFASSIAATDTRCNYGIGKAYLEQRLRGRASPRFRPLSVRIPVVEAEKSSGNFDIAADRFAPAFLEAARWSAAIEALLGHRAPPYDGSVVPLGSSRGAS